MRNLQANSSVSRGARHSWLTHALLLVTVALTPHTAAAQALGWSGTVEASGNVLFGNTSDRLIAGRVQAARADSTLEVRSDLRFTYAEHENDEGRRQVKGRTAFALLGLDYQPFARYSPFAFASIESSLQQRIARRYSTGLGAKLTLHDADKNEASISLALLGERTRPRQEADAPLVDATWRTRWSLRPRLRWRLTTATTLSHVTFYQPSVDRLSRYTINSTTGLVVDLTSAVGLTVTFHDTYDSEARARGARRNNDGQFLFGVRARLQ